MVFLYGLLVLPLLVLEILQVNAGQEPWDSPPDYPWWIPVVVMCPPEGSEIPSQHQRFCEQKVARPPLFPVGGPVNPGKPPMFPVEPPMFPVGGPVNPGRPPMFPVTPQFPIGGPVNLGMPQMFPDKPQFPIGGPVNLGMPQMFPDKPQFPIGGPVSPGKAPMAPSDQKDSIGGPVDLRQNPTFFFGNYQMLGLFPKEPKCQTCQEKPKGPSHQGSKCPTCQEKPKGPSHQGSKSPPKRSCFGKWHHPMHPRLCRLKT